MTGTAQPSAYGREYYESSCGGHEFYRAYGVRVLKPALAYCLKRSGVRLGDRVLDVGCGRGELLYHLRQLGAFAAGVDFSKDAAALAENNSGCPVDLCDLKSLPFSAASFDAVFLIGVLDHVSSGEMPAALQEIARVLKPEGRLILHTCANSQYHKNLTYGARRAAARVLGLPEPRPPRSSEDAELHVNELSAGRLRRFLRGQGWAAEVRAMPNYKVLARELYGKDLPEGFPLKPSPEWKTALYRALFRTPLARVLGRELFALARFRGSLLK